MQYQHGSKCSGVMYWSSYQKYQISIFLYADNRFLFSYYVWLSNFPVKPEVNLSDVCRQQDNSPHGSMEDLEDDEPQGWFMILCMAFWYVIYTVLQYCSTNTKRVRHTSWRRLGRRRDARYTRSARGRVAFHGWRDRGSTGPRLSEIKFWNAFGNKRSIPNVMYIFISVSVLFSFIQTNWGHYLWL